MPNNIVPMQKTIQVEAFNFSAGTWTPTLNGTRKSIVKTAAADGQIFITIPLNLDRPWNQYGARIKEIFVPYIMGTLAPTAAIAMSAFNRHNIDNPTTGAGTTVSQTSVSGLYSVAFQQGQNVIDGATLATTAAIIVTPINGTGTWESEAGSVARTEYSVQFSITPAATTTLTLYPAEVRYETQIG